MNIASVGSTLFNESLGSLRIPMAAWDITTTGRGETRISINYFSNNFVDV